jgi:C-terminal processing protease CtpA/Prc
MLHGTKIENTLFGGPAFGQLMKGDILVKIDGEPVSEESIISDLRGNDIPGSKVALTVRRVKGDSQRRMIPISHSPFGSPNISTDDNDTEEIEIVITRIATAEIADKRRMFDHFTTIQVC